MPKILFLSPSQDDFLAATILHGLRDLQGPDVLDFPRYDCMYEDYPKEKLNLQHGRGFTLFGRLADPWPDRKARKGPPDPRDYNLTIFSDIWNQTSLFLDLLPRLNVRKTAIVDGSDDPALVPHAGFWFRRPTAWTRLRVLRKFRTWKREWTPRSRPNAWHRLIPRVLLPLLPRPRHLRRISFGIPEDRVLKVIPDKTKEFPAHIVDDEVRALLGVGSGRHVFEQEEDYHNDLRASRFGITMKRSGWDCLRHYEIAANGAVPCFRNLEKKPETCAPHGLTPANSLGYLSGSDLVQITRGMGEGEYRRLQTGALEWARQHSTRAVASHLLREALGQP